MRIKNLKVKNIYNDGKKLNMSFTEKENIILIRQPNDENSFIPFTPDFLELTDFLFFNDSYTCVKNMLSNKSLLECTLEKDGVEYTIGVKGNCSKAKKDGKVCMQNVSNWYCILPEKKLQGKNGGWLGAQLSCEPQEYFYPYALQDFSKFYKDTYADSPADFVYGEEFSWLQRMAKYNKCEVDLEKKLHALINDFTAIKLDEHISVGLDQKGEYVLLFDGETVPDEMLSVEEELCVNFCGWTNNLNVLKELCEFVGEEGDFPVFIDKAFDDCLGEHKHALFAQLQKTGRQVFIVSRKHDEDIEKYCDCAIVLQ